MLDHASPLESIIADAVNEYNAEESTVIRQGFFLLHEFQKQAARLRGGSFWPPGLRQYAITLIARSCSPETRHNLAIATGGLTEHYPPAETFDVDPNRDFFIAPNYPLCRLPGRYEADSYKPLGQPFVPKTQRRARSRADNPEDESGTCTKVSNDHATLTPGILSFFCPHGICLLTHIMPRYEGPSIPFETIFSRFRDPPRFIIYDNACNFSRYCLRREALFFSRSRMLIDRFHENDHTGCPHSFRVTRNSADIELIPTCTAPCFISGTVQEVTFPAVTLGVLNTQVAEQCHSVLDGIRTQMAFMTFSNFRLYLALFFSWYNDRKRRNMLNPFNVVNVDRQPGAP